jgi:hypothetical protein
MLQVYKEKIHKRMPGEGGAGMAGIIREWIKGEPGSKTGQFCSQTFTRVTISNLKQDILDQFQEEEGASICKQLAHMYHYYLHGAAHMPRAGAEPAACVVLCAM